MIVTADFLHDVEKDDLVAFSRYLTAAGVSETDYAIVPAGAETADAPVVIGYEAKAGDYARASIRFAMADGPAAVTLPLPEAGMFLCMLLAHGWAERAVAIPARATPLAAFDALTLNEARFWRDTVRATDEGEHVAPDEGGFAYYFVDTRGAVTVKARADLAAPLIILLGADLTAEKLDLAGKLGAIRPD